MNTIDKFISGNEYALQELFGGDTKLLIPDLQRDYCWGDNAYISTGDKKPRELVSDFVKNIVEMFVEDGDKRVTLGLIYGYEQPHNHIQICDGQQRLTTLFLLLGYINIQVDGKFNHYIISEKEMNDDYEPHLQYAIRESTLYFLSDLSRKVFIDRTTNIEDIRKSNWYFNEYEQDASIQSMIAALNTIHQYFKDNQNIDYCSFGEYILKNLRVLYYDMDNRSRGEETYVVINTTGEPLSATENIKPILLGNPNLSEADSKKYSDQWEEREDWFWQNRGADKTSDAGMQDFFMWYWQIGLIQESRWVGDKKLPLNTRDLFISAPKKITENTNEIKLSLDNYTRFQSLDNLNKYFKALNTLVDQINTDVSLKKVLLTIKKKNNNFTLDSKSDIWNWLRLTDLDIVLPLLTLLAEHKDTSMLLPFARRLRKNHYDGVWSKYNGQTSRRGENYMDWRYLVQIVNHTNDDNLLHAVINTLDISKIPMVNIPEWYTEDEKQKTKLSDQSVSIEEMEDNEFMMGDLTPLWSNVADIDSAAAIEKRWKVLQRICDAFDPQKAIDDAEFANWFRLYRLVSGLVGFQHINNCKWTFEGCYYSLKPNTPWWIETPLIESILNSESPVSYMKQFVKEKVGQFITQPSDYKELVISWITLKTIQADNNKYLINYRNDRAISAFFDLKSNYIYPIEDFHWGNVLCGYSYSYSVIPTRNEDSWEKPEKLDSPIVSIPFVRDYHKRNFDTVDWDLINKGDEAINEIIASFWGRERLLLAYLQKNK